MTDFPFSEEFPPRVEADSLSTETEYDLFEWYVEKSEKPKDHYWRMADELTGGGLTSEIDYLPQDSGMPLEEKI